MLGWLAGGLLARCIGQAALGWSGLVWWGLGVDGPHQDWGLALVLEQRFRRKLVHNQRRPQSREEGIPESTRQAAHPGAHPSAKNGFGHVIARWADCKPFLFLFFNDI